MQLHGLSDQWGTRDELFAFFASTGFIDSRTQRCDLALELLTHLESLEGPDIYVGTSHFDLLFSVRDTYSESDVVSIFATSTVVRSEQDAMERICRVGFRRIDGVRPTREWMKLDCHSAQDAALRIATARKFADLPLRNN